MALVRGLLKLVVFAVLAMVLFVGGWISGPLGIGRVVDPASLTEAERQFADRMRNVDMVGTFTVWPCEERTPRTDRYEIVSVERYRGRPVALQYEDGLLRAQWHDHAHRGADALGRRHAGDHDDERRPPWHRHLHRARVLLR